VDENNRGAASVATKADQTGNTNREASMNWDQVEGKWKQAAGKVKEKWGKLTDSDLEVIRGRRDQLIGKIQERYGIAKEEAQKQADEFTKTLYLADETDSTARATLETELRDEFAGSGGTGKTRGAGRS
jgi:uncharacterized protein YjbJ (UPF0337 family)